MRCRRPGASLPSGPRNCVPGQTWFLREDRVLVMPTGEGREYVKTSRKGRHPAPWHYRSRAVGGKRDQRFGRPVGELRRCNWFAEGGLQQSGKKAKNSAAECREIITLIVGGKN